MIVTYCVACSRRGSLRGHGVAFVHAHEVDPCIHGEGHLLGLRCNVLLRMASVKALVNFYVDLFCLRD